MKLSFLESNTKNRSSSSKIPSLFSRSDLADKHVLKVKDIFRKCDPQKRLYPNGLLSELEEENSAFDFRPVKRIELFAKNERTKATYGIIRNFFVGFSSERSLLDLANFSDNVISVRTVLNSSWRGEHSEVKIIEDKLVLKTLDGTEKARQDIGRFSTSSIIFTRSKTPALYVSSRWLDKMELCEGDRIIVSNPVEDYVTPPPILTGAN